jgi:hypothetical protein
MWLAALALDYDGGVIVLLVTGPILSQLRRVAGDLNFVDGIIGARSTQGTLRRQ